MLKNIASTLLVALGALLILNAQSTSLLQADDSTESRYAVSSGNKCHKVIDAGRVCVTCSLARDETKCVKCPTEGKVCSDSDFTCGNLRNASKINSTCPDYDTQNTWVTVIGQDGDPIKCKKLKKAEGDKDCPKADSKK